MRRPASLVFVTAAAMWLARPEPVWAALGDTAASIESDRIALRGSAVARTAHVGFTVHELRVGSSLVREYVSPAGLVFAVAWNGLTHPDLSTLLGSYHAEYADARRNVRAQGSRRHQTLETDNVVVETWGHMRSLQGRAYVPALVPPGVDVHDLS
jgi:hypothetical protein